MNRSWSRLFPSSLPLALAVALLALGAGACQPTPEGTPEARLAGVDSILTELGGTPTANMSRGQRWRMISSIGAGLPPAGLDVADLPDAGSRGSVVLQTYCARCHQLPAPQMHAAVEWPILVRRMVLRARTLHDRMGGPVMREILGDVLTSGMASAEVPSREEVDSLVAYLQAHALQVVDPASLGTGPEVEEYVEACGICHDVPDPAAHSADEWVEVVARMRTITNRLDVGVLSADISARMTAYLTGYPAD